MAISWMESVVRAISGERRSSRRAVVPAALASLGATALPVAGATGMAARRRSGASDLPRLLGASKPRGEGGPSAVKKTKLGVRKIYYTEECVNIPISEYPEGIVCGVPCPETMQAIGGGVLDLTANALMLFDSPWEDLDYAWGATFVPLGEENYGALPFVVCMNR